jgi:glucose/arabinose dehydrogenase
VIVASIYQIERPRFRCAVAKARTLASDRAARVMLATVTILHAPALVAPGHAATLPPGFQETAVITGRYQPTAVRFAPNGQVFVAEKSGLLWAYDGVSDTSPVLVADLRAQVHNFWDRGLLGLAIDPNYPSSPHLYVLYTHDVFPNGTGPRWGTGGANPTTDDPCPTPPGPVTFGCLVFGRLSRIVVNTMTMQGSEEPLLDGNWCQQFPSHSLGDLVFGEDGYLYTSAGDGASFNYADWGQTGDPVNPCDDPPDGIGGPNSGTDAEGGALRSQDILTPFDPASYDGTVLRIDVSGPLPVAPPDNPLVGNGVPDDDFIIAIGLRNPYRMNHRPGTDEIWIADVGWGTWEELNRITSPTGNVKNFGWPCYEGNNAGNAVLSGYSGRDLCQVVYNQALPGGTVKVPPHYAYRHNEKVVTGELCPTGSSAITGVAFHRGSNYPAEFANALYFADSSRQCVWTMFADAGGDPDKTNRAPLVSQAAGRVVDIQMGLDDHLYYVDFDGGKVFRIEYIVQNDPPTARATAQPSSGVAPLLVQFDASTSSDPEDGSNLAYAWDLDDDGQFDDSTLVNPTSVFTQAGAHAVHLRVEDSGGKSDTDTVVVTVGNTAPVAEITLPVPPLGWSVGQTVAFAGTAVDDNDGVLPPSQMSWKLFLHHCPAPAPCQVTQIAAYDGVAGGSFSAPDHEYPAFLELRLTATDLGPTPLSHTVSVFLEPQTVFLILGSIPPGMGLLYRSTAVTAPYSVEVIVGSTNPVTASSPQARGDTVYTFASWSDGGSQSHDVTAPATTSMVTATFDPGGGCQLGTPPGCDDGNACNGVETCDLIAGGHAATPLVCADSNPCTDDGCDAGSGCTFTFNDAPCDDGSTCTTSDRCSAGACVGDVPLACNDGNPCTTDTCDDVTGCLHDTAPLTGCLEAGRSLLLIKDQANPASDRLKWTWRRGPELGQAQLGSPRSDTQYALCVYDFAGGAPSLASALIVNPGAAWQDQDPGGYSYVDKTGAAAGIQKIRIKTGSAGRSGAQASARGANLPLPAAALPDQLFAQEPAVTVQLVNDAGACWTSRFETPSRNTGTLYKAKAN